MGMKLGMKWLRCSFCSSLCCVIPTPHSAALYCCTMQVYFLPPVGRAWSKETAQRRWKEKVLDSAVIHLLDCTAALSGIDCSRGKPGIASELHPHGAQISEGFG